MDVFDATLPEQTADWAYLAPWHAGADLLVLDDSNTAFASAPVRAYKGRNAEHSRETLRLTEDGHASELTVELVLQGAMAGDAPFPEQRLEDRVVVGCPADDPGPEPQAAGQQPSPPDRMR